MNIALKPFLKAVTPALVGLATMVISWVATGDWSAGEFGILLAGLLTAGATYVVPNVASTPFLKALVAPVLGVVAVGARAIEVGSLDVASLRLSVASVLTGALVFAVPNLPPPPSADTPTASDVGKPMQGPEPSVGDPRRLPTA